MSADFWLGIILGILLKACVCNFLSKFYVSPNYSPAKTMKNIFFSSKKLDIRKNVKFMM